MGIWVGKRTLRKQLKTLSLLLPVSGAVASIGILRATVLSRYSQLPQLVPLEGITLFELCVVTSWALAAILIAVLARRDT